MIQTFVFSLTKLPSAREDSAQFGKTRSQIFSRPQEMKTCLE